MWGEIVMMKELLIQFFDAYLVKRDLEEALSFLSDQVISLGTGAQEIARNKSELRELMIREFQAIPNGFHYEIRDYLEHCYPDGLFSIYCSVITSMPDENDGELLFQTRLTATAARLEDGWKIVSLHMSAPSDQQEEEEFFPIKYGRQAIGKLGLAANKNLIDITQSMLPGGIMGAYLEKGLPLYIINDTMLHYLGYTYDEFVEATGEEMERIIEPQDWNRVEKAIYDGFHKNGSYDVQYRVIRKDGTRMWVNDKGREITTEDGRKAMVSVMLDISEDILLQQKLMREVMEDFLTGILNRKGALFHIEGFLKKHQPGALFLLDIDNFKKVNDTYGHQTGDQVLSLLANILRKNTRQEDVAARIGGDEFLLFLPGCTQPDVLRNKAERIRSLFCGASLQFDKVELSVSIGICIGDGYMDVDRLLKIADDKLYSVKKSGKGGFLL